MIKDIVFKEDKGVPTDRVCCPIFGEGFGFDD
jgi:hypothetical protein